MFKKLLGLSILLFFTTPVFADLCEVGEECEDKLSFESANGAVVDVSLSTLKQKIIHLKSKKGRAK